MPTATSQPDSRQTLARGLANAIEGEVRFGLHDRMLYATDASLYQVEPIGVVIPTSVNDAVAAVEWCSQNNVAILPRGGGTSLAGQCTNHAVVIDFTPGCRALLELDTVNAHARVEPGRTIDDLNDEISSTGLFFAADPATSRHAAFGGCVGNNAAGARSVRYGRTSENIIGVDALVLTTGGARRVRFEKGASTRDSFALELTRRVCDVVAAHASLIKDRYPKTLRRNAGYGLDMVLADMDRAGWRQGEPLTDAHLAHVNIAHLLCGSEGTLAVTLSAHIKLHPKPKAKGLAVLGFTTLDAAIAVVPELLKTNPTAIELLDDTVIDLARANAEYRKYVELMPAPTAGPLKAVLYVEYFAQDPAEITRAFEALRPVVGTGAAQYHTNAQAMLNAWKLRKAGEPLLHGVPGARKPITFVEDNAIPVENLATFVTKLRDIVARHGTWAAFYAHASVGVLHVRPLIDIHDPADRDRMVAIAVETADLAKSLGGVMSGEHGDGRIRSPLLERFYGPELMNAMRQIKAIFDPRNLLNPGNIVEPRPIESITHHLRVEPQRGRPVSIPPGLDTYFDYSDQHGLDGAVEMCNGAGVCRKLQGGTMCPSYQATLDERHSTRGRGNALRLAITGQLNRPDDNNSTQKPPASRWNDPGTIETLNLCLSCKACKTECPSNVDISRLKSEYTAQGMKAAGRVPFQAAIFGAIRTLNRLGSLTPRLANVISSTPPARWVAKKLLHIDPRRSLPSFAKSLARQWSPTPTPASASASTRKVVLFGDCFTMFNEPGIGLATKAVLEAFGYTILLADAGCCGRAKISLGLLGAATHEIDATITKLRPLIDDPSIAAILVAEPSCLSAMKDDWLGLKLTSPLDLRKRLAAKAFLPEQFLEKFWEGHPARPSFQTPSEAILFHGHCHQKALWGNESSSALLTRILGTHLRILDTGCCGMAGAFGFTTDRFDLSMKIANLTLVPAVNAAPAATILATGTSCRHQLHDAANRQALHPMQLLASLLISS